MFIKKRFKDVLENIMLSYDRKNVPNANGVDVKVDLIIQVLNLFIKIQKEIVLLIINYYAFY